MSYYNEYQQWKDREDLEESVKTDLSQIGELDAEIKARFDGRLEFGTAGLRGLMGAGPNRMNVYTVRLATNGLARMIAEFGEDVKKRGVVVACDSRNQSELFAKEAACVLAAAGIKTYLFDSLRPTPELSFAVRTLHCIAGINITASHNPKEYNGYKAYWEDGAQLSPELAEKVMSIMQDTDLFSIRTGDCQKFFENDMITVIGTEMDEAYLKAAAASMPIAFDKKDVRDIKIVYTPFHGAGYRLVPELLRRGGFDNIITVEKQMTLDGNFPTVKSPNPSNTDGFSLAIALAEKENADIIIGTDPDADRVVALAKDGDGRYKPFSGNQMGALLIDYIIRCKKEAGTLPTNCAVVKSIVSTYLADAICEANEVRIINVLTGFKYIGEKIKEFEETSSMTYLFGFEESCGYLAGIYARDKDAVASSLLIAEMTQYYKLQGKTLWDIMQGLYGQYGYYLDKALDISVSGSDFSQKITAVVSKFRDTRLEMIADITVRTFTDLKNGIAYNMRSGESEPVSLPKADVLLYQLADSSSVVVRPSGTEPKIKIYIFTSGATKEDAENKLRILEQSLLQMVNY